MIFLYFLSLILLATADGQDDQNWLNCKPKSGCSLLKCDPLLIRRGALEANLRNNEYSIVCENPTAKPDGGWDMVVQMLMQRVDDVVKKVDQIEDDNEKRKLDIDEYRDLEADDQTKREVASLKSKNKDLKERLDELESRVNERKGDSGEWQEDVANLIKSTTDNLLAKFQESERKTNAELKSIRNDIQAIQNQLRLPGSRQIVSKPVVPTTVSRAKTTGDPHAARKRASYERLKSKGLCPIRHKDRCFWMRFQSTPPEVSKILNACVVNGGAIGNVYDKGHYDRIVTYASNNMPSTWKVAFVWMGVKQDPTTKMMYLHDGSRAPYIQHVMRMNHPVSSIFSVIVLRGAPPPGGKVHISQDQGFLCQLDL